MNAVLKIATITNLIAEIGDCEELQYSLDGFIKVLTDLKSLNPTGKGGWSCFENELNEAYREGKKDGREEVEDEIRVAEEEEEEDNDGKVCMTCNVYEPLCKFSDTLPNGEYVIGDKCASCCADEEEEEEEHFPPCGCNPLTDMRSRCDPVLSAVQFSTCVERYSTAYFHIMNDFEKNKDIEASCSREEKQKKITAYAKAEPFFLEDEYDELVELIEEDEQENEEFCCFVCDQFIPYTEEKSAKYCDEEERLICYSCKNDCFCGYCEEYFPDEGELEYRNLTEDDTTKLCVECLNFKEDDE